MQEKDAFELERMRGVPPRNDKNVRPGDRMGLSPQAVKQYIKRQKRCKGEAFTIAAGDNPGLQVQLPGTARVWLGFVIRVTDLGNADLTGNLSLVINNEVVIDDVFVDFYGSDFTDEEYFFMPRPLSGQDDVEFRVNGVVDKYTLNVNNYYL